MKNSKSTIKVKVIATTLALVCAASAVTAVSAFAGDSFKNNASYSATENNFSNSGNDLHFVKFASDVQNYDWNYGTDTLNVKVTCDYDYNTQKYDFTIKGVTPGKSNVRLMFVNDMKQWETVTVEVNVDKNLKVSLANASKNEENYQGRYDTHGIITRMGYDDAVQAVIDGTNLTKDEVKSVDVARENDVIYFTVVFSRDGQDYTFYVKDSNGNFSWSKDIILGIN